MPLLSNPETRPLKRAMLRPPTPASEYEDNDDRSRRSARPARDEGDDDGGPRRGRRNAEEPGEDVVRSGWAGARKTAQESPSDFAPTLKIPEDGDPVVIKFLQEGPVASYQQHWCDWMPEGQKKSYVCIKTDCPICDLGEKSLGRFVFNVLDFTDPDNPSNALLIVGLKLSNLIEKLSKDKRSGPLDRPDVYFAVSKTGGGKGKRGGGQVQTNFKDVKARDLEEDYGIAPLDDEELDKFTSKVFPKADAAPTTPRRELEKVAETAED